VIARHVPKARRGEKLRTVVLVAHHDAPKAAARYGATLGRSFSTVVTITKTAAWLVPLFIALRALPQLQHVGLWPWYVTLAPAVVRWSADRWATAHDAATTDSGLGVHFADLPTQALPAGAEVVFTFRWPEARRWEGVDFSVAISREGGRPAKLLRPSRIQMSETT
jgi:hypothetical protein